MPHSATNIKILTVSELTGKIAEIIDSAFPLPVYVSGEVSNYARNSKSGHGYFSLKDEVSVVRCVMFRQELARVKFEIENGMEVIVVANVSVYKPYGQYQLVCTELHPKGIGALQIRFEQLKKKLEAEGIFDPGRKKPLPFLPRRVAVITSPSGAAVHDIITTIKKRFPRPNICVIPVKVQGEEAAGEIAAAIDIANNSIEGVEVIIVGRGGGSIEDLWAFNEEKVIRAISRSRIPIVSAVGHETDVTLADFAADVRAKTPTEAGTLVYPDYDAIIGELQAVHSKLAGTMAGLLDLYKTQLSLSLEKLRDPSDIAGKLSMAISHISARLAYALSYFVSACRSELDSIANNYLLKNPMNLVAEKARQLLILQRTFGMLDVLVTQTLKETNRARDMLDTGINHIIDTTKLSLSSLGKRLSDMDPLKVLERGYSITRLGREIVTDSSRVKKGDEISITLSKGSLEATVTDTARTR